MPGFGLAPMKTEGGKITYDELNPHVHPRHIRDTAGQIRAKAQAYFGWELMNGADIEKLKQDPYWSYMEGEENA